MTDIAPSPLQNLYLGRQPILDRMHRLSGFELLYRSSTENVAQIQDEISASSAVFSRIFADLHVDSVIGSFPMFVNISPTLLLSEMVEIVSKLNVVLEIVSAENCCEGVVERCAQLRRAGYRIALDGYVQGNAFHAALLGSIDYIKVDISVMTAEDLRSLSLRLKEQSAAKLIAQRVETRAQASLCAELGFDYLQGHFFAKPVIVQGKRLNPSELGLIQLLGVVIGDGDDREMVATLKHHPDLSLKLLRLANSAAAGAKTRINSLEHGIVVLGRTAIRRWTQILLFAEDGTSGGSEPSPLLMLAAGRGKLMELMAEKLGAGGDAIPEQAFLAGMLSLMDARFGIDLLELLSYLRLEAIVTEALLERSGTLGTMLVLAECLEQDGFADAQFTLQGFEDLDPAMLVDLQLRALRWTNDFGQ